MAASALRSGRARPFAGGSRRFLPLRPARWPWTIAALAVAGAALLPIALLARLAFDGGLAAWPHLLAHVMPDALFQTIVLLGGVGILVTAIGAGAAWLVTAYEFPGRRVLDWALLLPLAVPAYIVAYVYGDLLHPVGPVQVAIRTLLGFATPADLRLPDIRSLGGAILLFGLVLYPYVYLTTRALFLMQSAGLVEVARTLGVPRAQLFRRIALPLARPAIALGAGLALMETLNDVAAATLLGVRPITVAIYTTWINQSDLAAAAQIALVSLVLVLGLVSLERWGRRGQGFALSAQRARPLERRTVDGARGWLCLAAGSVPALLGFGVPFAVLAGQAAERVSFAGLSRAIVDESLATLAISAAAASLAVAAGLVVAFAGRSSERAGAGPLGRIAAIGYAVPGTVLGLGLLPVSAWFAAPASAGPLAAVLAAGALVYAYAVRFLAIPVGGVEAGFARIPASLDGAARTLGRGPAAMLARIHLPLAAPSIAAAAILTFVDCMKELPIALLLRPLNVETLSTHLYGEAIRGTYEDGAVAALLIVLVGLLPVVLLSRVTGLRSVTRG